MRILSNYFASVGSYDDGNDIAELHWLPIKHRIQYKIAVTVFKVLTILLILKIFKHA